MDNAQIYNSKSRSNFIILGLLIACTAITVAASYIDFGFFNIIIAFSIATTKAGLVVLYFMHLGHEERAIRLMVLATCFILALIIGCIFFDIAMR